MKKQHLMAILIALVVIQISVPASLIVKYEKAKSRGTIVKFRIRPFDPYDAFRGRFLSLDIEGNREIPCEEEISRGQKVYGLVKTNSDGFSVIEKVVANRPSEGLFIETTANYSYNDKAFLDLPFARYYINENLARDAEKAYRAHATFKNSDVYITVSINNGVCVLNELYISGKPVREFLKNPNP